MQTKMQLPCKHREHIEWKDGVLIGRCKDCGQVKNYTELHLKSGIIERGMSEGKKKMYEKKGYEYMGDFGKSKYVYPVQGSIGVSSWRP